MNRRFQLSTILLGLVLIALLVVPFLVPVPPLENVESEIAWGGIDSRFITIQYPGTDGIALHYLDSGSGRVPVVLLHSESADLYEWQGVMQNLSTVGRTIAYDRPPYGLSEHMIPERWSGDNPYTTRAAVNMLITFLDDLLIQKAVLVASAGASRIALEAALLHPDRVAELVLVAPDIAAAPPSLAGVVGNIPQVDRLGPLMVRSRAEEQPAMLRQIVADPSIIDQALMNKLTLTYRVQNWDRAVWESTKAAAPTDFSTRLGSLSMPVLILAGDSDPVVALSVQQALAAQIPGARLEVMRATGHLPHLEHPGEVSKILELLINQSANTR